ncbi:MAG: hypothetical protein SAK42_10470 [Oscillatoria sp. PMC 1076.18]|nr:hypothetical protein [Oscillatoria sp. PMC 1076.18]
MLLVKLMGEVSMSQQKEKIELEVIEVVASRLEVAIAPIFSTSF